MLRLIRKLIITSIQSIQEMRRDFYRRKKIEKEGVFYAQFLEDYVLSIVFNEVDKGFYVDVGAYHPSQISVTKYFYLRGWRGINIEPLPNQFPSFLAERPDDVNLNIGIAENTGELSLCIVTPVNQPEHDALSTFKENVVDIALKEGCVYTTVAVPVRRLDDVLEEHPMSVIHFMKIVVEGMEEEVLKSIDLSVHRPWVLVMKATEPRKWTREDHKWNYILQDNKYIEMMFDGMDVYYVAQEKYSLLEPRFKNAFKKANQTNRQCKIIDNQLQYLDKGVACVLG